MLVFFVIFTFISLVRTTSICDSKCLCFQFKDDETDFFGDQIRCSYSDPNLLNSDYTLPDLVQSLDLSSNNISVLQSSTLLNSATMGELMLNKNFIREIRNVTLRLPALKRLDLSYNLLEYIDKETFKGMKKLQHLNLANNRFTTFTDMMFHRLSNLHEIILNNNNIGASLKHKDLFDRTGYGLTNKIKSISISGINLNKVPDNFFVDAYDLRKLIISNNGITDIFELPYTLEYLDLSDNPIVEIAGEDFYDTPGLRVLKLNNLHITEVSGYTFDTLHALKRLELERNMNLTEFSSFAFGHEVLTDADEFALEKLSLRASRLTSLDDDLMVPFGQLMELNLQGNPWECDCKMKWVKKLQIPEDLTEHVRCGSPPPLFNAKIFELKAKFFVCTQKRHVGILAAVVSVCVILAMVAMWIFVCLPKRQTRGALIREMHLTSAAYTVLPVSSGVHDG